MKSTQLKSVPVPIQILNLPNVSLSEKLLLACIAAQERSLIRALSMNGPGIKRLKRQLIAKRLLKRFGRRYTLTIPGMEHVENCDGHFLNHSEASKKEQKVATPPSSPRPLQDGILLLGPILELSDLIASEKFVLSLFAADPRANNALVLQVLGISLAGLKKIKRRLLDSGLLAPSDSGYRINVAGMWFQENAEGGYFLAGSDGPPMDEKVAVAVAKIRSAEAIRAEWRQEMRRLQDEALAISDFFITARCAIKEIHSQTSPEDPMREVALYEMKLSDDYYSILYFIQRSFPEKDVEKAMELAAQAPAEKRAEFLEKIRGKALGGVSPQKLIGMFTGSTQSRGGRKRQR